MSSWVNGGSCNVKSYGAKGDGITDDTAAIQAAITAMSSFGAVDEHSNRAPVLEFPPGRYQISSGLSLSLSYVRIVGNKAKIRATASMTAMFTVGDAGSGAVSEQVEIEGLLLDGNTLAQYGVWIKEGQNLHFSNVTTLETLAAGWFVDGSGNGGAIRVLNLLWTNCFNTSYNGDGFYLNKANNSGSYQAFTFVSCGCEGRDSGAYGVRCVGGFGAEVVGGTFQAYRTAGVSADGTRLTLRDFYSENVSGSYPSLIAINGARVVLSGCSLGSGYTVDATSTVFQHDNSLSNAQSFLVSNFRTGKIADRPDWGCPTWPLGLGGSVNHKGDLFVDKYGTEWLCTTAGTGTASRWMPRYGRFVIPIPYAGLSNGFMMWWAMEDFIVSELLWVITTTYTGTATYVSFGNDGGATEAWISQAQGALGGLTAGTVINAALNAHASNLLGTSKKKFLAGGGGASSGAGTSSIRQYDNGDFTAGNGYLIVNGEAIGYD